ncbi:MAG: DUF1801 domain-containing protein [Pirellulaceae bacterium]
MTEQKDTPAKQLATFVAKFDPPIQKTVRAARKKLRHRMESAVELVYDNYNALAIGYGPNEQSSKAIISLAVYPRWVLLYFLHGASLKDPKKILQGSGNQGRFVKLESANDIDLPEVSALIQNAIRSSSVPFGEKKGRTVIKSISKKQRPRSGNSKN